MNDHDELELPRVQSAVLDAETLDALLEDIDSSAEILSVWIRLKAGAHASSKASSLDTARELLLRGGIAGVQLRYRHKGTIWSDTLMLGDQGVRLVRCAIGAAAPPSAVRA